MGLMKQFCLKVLGICGLVLVLGAAVVISPTTAFASSLADGTYSASGLSTAVLNMYKFHDPYVVVNGDSAWLITTSDEGNSTVRYDGMAYGPQSQILDPSDPTNHTLVTGTPTAAVFNNYGSDGVTLETRTFVLPISKDVLEARGNIYYMIKYVAGYSSSHDGDWYKAGGGDYYFTGYTLEYLSDSTLLPGDDPTPIDGTIDLAVTNAASGISASRASVTSDTAGNTSLTVDLAGNGADWLYVGTLAQALATGSTDAGWIQGAAQDDGFMRFTIPISAAMDYLPFSVVASSASSDIASGIHPFQFILDINAATLRLERYDNIFDIPVAVDPGVAPHFAAASTASIRVIGGPNDNTFKCAVTLSMEDGVHDYIEYPSSLDGSLIQAGTALSNGSFFLVFDNSAGASSFDLGQASPLSIHHADSDLWLDRTMTIDLAAGVVRIGGSDEGVAVAKALIEALPRDPLYIREDDSDAVAKAAAAYNALSAEAQEQLDADRLPFTVLLYGRVLENAQWALEAIGKVTSTTTLPDGVYTTGIESTSSMGKSQSSRSKGFKVKSITVRDGSAIATLEHESTTDGTMLVNGREYFPNKVANSSDYRTYDVPIDLNSTFHLVWKAQDAGDAVVGISYEMTNSIDESRTSPDSALPSDEGSSSADPQGLKDLLDAIAKLIASQSSSSGKTPSVKDPNATSSGNSSALAAAAASRTGSAGNYGKSGAASEDSEDDGTPVATKASMDAGGNGGINTTGVAGSSTSGQLDTEDAAVALGAVLLCIAALGVLGFTIRFLRRERQR